MAYATGIANNSSEIRAAIVSLATSNGWTEELGSSTTITGTYSRSGTTVTVTSASHGIATGTSVYLDFTSGSASDNFFTVTGTTTNTFTITHTASGTTSGNVIVYKPHIISKSGVYVKLFAINDDVLLRIGTGYASNDITGAAARYVSMYGGTSTIDGYSTGTIYQVTYPATYHVFVNTLPDDIVCFVNYNVSWWQWLMVGQGNNLTNTLDPSDGKYQAGSFPWVLSRPDVHLSWNILVSGTEQQGSTLDYPAHTPFPFWAQDNTSTTGSLVNRAQGDSVAYGGVWRETNASTYGQNTTNARRFASTFLNVLPNAWNDEITLIRTLILYPESSTQFIYIAELPHIRFTRNDNYNDGDTITLGSEQWMIFPGLRKNAASRSSGDDHSGTVAIAVRKTT
jgi:hypothetical protein